MKASWLPRIEMLDGRRRSIARSGAEPVRTVRGSLAGGCSMDVAPHASRRMESTRRLETNPWHWSAEEVARWAARRKLTAGVIQAIAKRKLSGAQMLSLRKEDMRLMFNLLGPRKEFQAVVGALRALRAPSTPEENNTSGGWGQCPWKTEAYLMRRGNPRFMCSYDPVSRCVEPPTGAFLALEILAHRVQFMYLYSTEEMGTLELTRGGAVLLPVACTASGDPLRYTLRKKETMEILPDPAYVNMYASAFCTCVVQLKPTVAPPGAKRTTGRISDPPCEHRTKRRRSRSCLQ